MISLFLAAPVEQNFGKVNITESSSDGFYCETVYFPSPFQNGGRIRVFPSLSHEDHPVNENEASVAMVTSIDQNSFSLCLMESARPTGEMTLNWFAFSDSILPQGVLTGSISYRAFTSGSSCNDVSFARVSFHPQIISSPTVLYANHLLTLVIFMELEIMLSIPLFSFMTFMIGQHLLIIRFIWKLKHYFKPVFHSHISPSLSKNFATEKLY